MSSFMTEPVSMTVEDLAMRVGSVPLGRVRLDPAPGLATVADVDRIRAVEKRNCELIDGVLVEKAVSEESALLAVEIARLLANFVIPARLGWVFGPDGFVWITHTVLRAPDVSFVRRHERPDGLKTRGYSHGAPALAVEIVSPGNTAREIEQKRLEFHAAGTELYWIVFPDRQEIEVSTAANERHVLRGEDILDGGDVLRGFSVRVCDIFAVLE